ncbi:MAG: hypothetical protein IPO81_19400 [Kouleothrix sp.]|nr:hypothetical protein [Kouleothrix sp.]
MLRSYPGFDAQPLAVTGALQRNRLAPYYSRLANTNEARDETEGHGRSRPVKKILEGLCPFKPPLMSPPRRDPRS